MKKKYSIILAIVLILFLVYKFLFMAPTIPDAGTYKIHLSDMRKMTKARHDLPLRINSLLIAKTTFPAKAIVASASIFQKTGMVFTSFQIVYQNHKTVILDTALNARLYEDMYRRDDVIDENFQKMQQGLLKADQIIITHEHLDHIGGIAQSPYLKDLYRKTYLTTEWASLGNECITGRRSNCSGSSTSSAA